MNKELSRAENSITSDIHSVFEIPERLILHENLYRKCQIVIILKITPMKKKIEIDESDLECTLEAIHIKWKQDVSACSNI